jgi:hypothetical protein
MADDYVILIRKERWQGTPVGVYPVPFKVLGKTKNGFEIEAPSDKVRAEHKFSFYIFTKREGISRRGNTGYAYARNKTYRYYVDRDIVLAHTTDPTSMPIIAAQFTALCEAYKAAQEALNEARSQTTHAFNTEEEEMRARHRAERDALEKRKADAVVVETRTKQAAWEKLWSLQRFATQSEEPESEAA